MRYQAVVSVMIAVMAALALASPARADEKAYTARGHGSALKVVVSGGMIFLNLADHEWTEGPARLSSLTAAPETASASLPVVLVELRYAINDGTGAYFGAPPEEFGKLGLGLTRSTPVGRLDVFLSAMSLVMPNEVWTDPYALGVDRVSTPKTEIGLRLKLMDAFETRLRLAYRVEYRNVTTDLTPTLYPGLGRDGLEHQAGVSWRWRAADGLHVEPGLMALYGDYEGEADSYTGLAPWVSAMYATRPVILMLLGRAEFTRYGAVHPVFGVERRDKRYLGVFTATRPELGGNRALSLTVGGSYSSTSSNIRYFEAGGSVGFVMVGYAF